MIISILLLTLGVFNALIMLFLALKAIEIGVSIERLNLTLRGVRDMIWASSVKPKA